MCDYCEGWDMKEYMKVKCLECGYIWEGEIITAAGIWSFWDDDDEHCPNCGKRNYETLEKIIREEYICDEEEEE